MKKVFQPSMAGYAGDYAGDNKDERRGGKRQPSMAGYARDNVGDNKDERWGG